MKKKSLGTELIESIEDALKRPATVKTVRSGIDVKKVRQKLNMTQKVFADTFGFGLETVRKWEQGINSPDRSVISYLLCIQKAPKVISKLLLPELKKQG
ncbi:MAG: type II toxin-antitoxin system MqsA family antitoxin [Cyanobacteria bacterium]|nr:type II toxin-antitoxin system MqsA family antitoxin [Cyanobacteriota bacterium]MDA1020293.1 type II toxin-antitoxin system MqsA family antitoxin [Cyanobacteriota bacterium]